jgi:hypothetical protein
LTLPHSSVKIVAARMKYLTTLEVANELKISKQTLLNWLYAKKVPEPPRNRNNYRLWSSARVSLIRKMIGDGRLHRRTVIHREPSKEPEVVAEIAREVSQKLPGLGGALLPGDVGHEEPLDRLALLEVGAADLGQVVVGHPRVPDVVGLNRDHRSPAAVLQAHGAVDHDPLLQAALLDDVAQGVVQGLRVLLATGPLRVPRRAGVDTDENLTLGPGHGSSSCLEGQRKPRCREYTLPCYPPGRNHLQGG